MPLSEQVVQACWKRLTLAYYHVFHEGTSVMPMSTEFESWVRSNVQRVPQGQIKSDNWLYLYDCSEIEFAQFYWEYIFDKNTNLKVITPSVVSTEHCEYSTLCPYQMYSSKNEGVALAPGQVRVVGCAKEASPVTFKQLLSSGGSCNVGDDAVGVSRDGNFFVVCDGVGENSATASAMAAAFFTGFCDEFPDRSIVDYGTSLLQSVFDSFRLIKKHDATTVTAVRVLPEHGELEIVHLGDCAVYLIDGNDKKRSNL